MENEAHTQKRAEFETTLTALPEEERTAKLTEWDQANPLQQPDDKENYRGKLNAQNRFLIGEGYEFKDGNWTKKVTPPAAEAPSKPELTAADALVLARADVHEDDLPRILKWAKDSGITVAEALKDEDLKVILDTHAEKRQTAAATHAAGGGRGGQKVSGDEILRKAESTGEVPETDEGMAALVQARQDKRTKKKH